MASVAQVYRGRLLASGPGPGPGSEVAIKVLHPRVAEQVCVKIRWSRSVGSEVALKVLHPRVAEQVAEDLALMRYAAGLLERHVPSLRTLAPLKVVPQPVPLLPTAPPLPRLATPGRHATPPRVQGRPAWGGREGGVVVTGRTVC